MNVAPEPVQLKMAAFLVIGGSCRVLGSEHLQSGNSHVCGAPLNYRAAISEWIDTIPSKNYPHADFQPYLSHSYWQSP